MVRKAKATKIKKRAKSAPKRKKSTRKKYSKASQNEVRKEMSKFKKGKARSGKGLAPVESPEQAIAIALSEARKKGMKVPKKKSKK